MKKIKITKLQKSMLESKASARLVMEMHIPRSQSPAHKVTKAFKKEAGSIEGFKAESLVNGKTTWIQLLPHVKELLIQMYTNPNKEDMNPFWDSVNVSWDDVVQMLSSVGLLNSVKGGYRLQKVVEEPTKALKIVSRLIEKMINDKGETVDEDMDLSKPMSSDDLFKGKVGEWLEKYENNRVKLLYNSGDYKGAWLTLRRIQEPTQKPQLEASNYPAGAEHDPNAPYNQVDPDMTDPSEGIDIKLKIIYVDDEISIFENDKGVKYFFYHGDSHSEIGEEYAPKMKYYGNHPDDYEETLPDDWDDDLGNAVELYVNDNIELLGIDTDWEDGEGLTPIDTKVKNQILKSVFTNKNLVAVLTGIDMEEASTASSSGSYTPSLSGGGPISKSNVGAEMSQLITDDEESVSVKDEIIKSLSDMISYEFSVEEWLAIGRDKLESIVIKIKNIPKEEGGEEWGLMIGYIIKSLQAADNYLEHKKPQFITSFRHNIDGIRNFVNHFEKYGIEEGSTTATAGGSSGTFAYDANALPDNEFMMAGNKLNKTIPLIKKSSKDINEIKAREGKNAQTDTQWPDGKFVEFDDCVRPGHNDVNIDGGCSVGAVDNVVKTRGSKNSVISDSSIYEQVANETGKTVEEVKVIIDEKIN